LVLIDRTDLRDNPEGTFMISAALSIRALQRPIHFSFIPNDSIKEKLTLLTVEAMVSDVRLNLKTVVRVCGQWVLII
jgi:hypothetical protein